MLSHKHTHTHPYYVTIWPYIHYRYSAFSVVSKDKLNFNTSASWYHILVLALQNEARVDDESKIGLRTSMRRLSLLSLRKIIETDKVKN